VPKRGVHQSASQSASLECGLDVEAPEPAIAGPAPDLGYVHVTELHVAEQPALTRSPWRAGRIFTGSMQSTLRIARIALKGQRPNSHVRCQAPDVALMDTSSRMVERLRWQERTCLVPGTGHVRAGQFTAMSVPDTAPARDAGFCRPVIPRCSRRSDGDAGQLFDRRQARGHLRHAVVPEGLHAG